MQELKEKIKNIGAHKPDPSPYEEQHGCSALEEWENSHDTETVKGEVIKYISSNGLIADSPQVIVAAIKGVYGENTPISIKYAEEIYQEIIGA